MLAKYKTVRDCFFGVCASDSRFFARNYFEDVWVKALFAVNVGALIVFKYLYLKDIKRFDLRRNNERITPGSYTVLVGNIDGFAEGQKLARFFEQMVPGVLVRKVNFVYNISEIYQIVRAWMKVEKKLTLLEIKEQAGTARHASLIAKRRKLKEDYYALKHEIKAEDSFDRRFTGFAFVTFDMQKHRSAALSKLCYRILSLQYHKTKYSIYPANEPEDVIWQNFGLTFKQRTARRFVSAAVSTLIIMLSFGIVCAIKYGQHAFSHNSRSQLFYLFIAFVITEIIILVNLILRTVLRRLTFWESMTTVTAYNSVLALKIAVVYFCNIALVLLVANVIVLRADLWGPQGVVGNIFIFQAIAVVSNSTYEALNPLYLWKKALRWYYLRRITRANSDNKVIQLELNKAYEGVNFDIAERYYLTFKTISVVFFFQLVMPYILLFGIAELTLIYWTQKYVLFRRAVRPKDIDFNFSLQMTRIFDLMIVILTLGYFVFEVIIVRRTSIYAIVLCAVAAGSAIAGEGISRLAFFNKKHEGTYIPFTEASKSFAADYDRLNPVTQKEAVAEWLSTIGAPVNSLKSLKELNELDEMNFDDRIFNTISRYVFQNKNYGSLPGRARCPSETTEQTPSNNDVSAIEINQLNFYKVASEVLDKQRSVLYKQKFLDPKSPAQPDKGNAPTQPREGQDSRESIARSLPQSQHSVSPFLLESVGNRKRQYSSLDHIQEEIDDIVITERSDLVGGKADGERNSSLDETSKEFEAKLRADFEKLNGPGGNDSDDTFNEEK